MPRDPASSFGSLLLGCINDNYSKPSRKEALESAASLFLGLAASIATAYLLARAGIFV